MSAHSSWRRRVGPALAAALITVALPATADVSFSPQDAVSLDRKIQSIVAHAASPARAARRTAITEREVNAYLRYGIQDQLPPGVLDPYVSILGDGRLAGRAIVDLDAIRREQPPQGLLDPVQLLTGRLPVEAVGVLRARDGVARLEIESASVSGVSVPITLLNRIVAHYSRTPENPAGVNLNDPFALPAGIREIHVDRGSAIVVQ